MHLYSMLILGLQAFCLYHAYQKKEANYWYFLIILFPIVGCLIYLFHAFYSKSNVNNLKEEISNTIDTSRKLNQLKSKLKHSDTISNRLALADEHMKLKNYQEAFEVYKTCLEGIYDSDPQVLKRLVASSYFSKNYELTIEYAAQLANSKEFEDSMEKAFFAMANHQLGNIERANSIFSEMNHPFSNYPQRLEYLGFLIEIGNNDKAIELTETIIDEIESMDREEKSGKRVYLNQAKQLLRTI